MEQRERQRIVDRLKDGPGQVLANLAMELRSLLYVLDADVQDMRPVLENMLQELEGGLSDLQEIVEELYPPVTFRELGLAPWLKETARRFQAQHGVKVRVEIQSGTSVLPPEVESIFYRVTQEALRNVVQHADASEVTIRVQVTPLMWRLEIIDNGRGVDEETLTHRYAAVSGKETFGLTMMQQLAEAVGGMLTLIRGIPQGTIVRLELPRYEADEEALR